MKKIVLILLMVIFPLQAALAAVENYHGHEASQVNHEHTVTNHGQSPETTPTSHCEGGHHHHCHAHHVAVLPCTGSFTLAAGDVLPNPERHTQFQSFLSNRIERPKWAQTKPE